jgi:hypothetical protein
VRLQRLPWSAHRCCPESGPLALLPRMPVRMEGLRHRRSDLRDRDSFACSCRTPKASRAPPRNGALLSSPSLGTSSSRRLSSREAREAVYVDFEGNADEPPFLLGILRAQGQLTTFEQVVVSDKQKWSLPGLDRKPLLIERLEKSIVKLLAMARAERRLIAAWSTHELDVIRTWCVLQPDDAEFLAAAYRNCIPVARSWKARCYPDLVFGRDTFGGRNRLYRYLDLIRYEIPSHLGREQTGQRLSHVTSQLERRGLRFDDLTPVAKRKWRLLLDHNRHDCYGLKALMEQATEGCARLGEGEVSR